MSGTGPMIDRAFVRLDEGLVHVRSVAGTRIGRLPLVLFHLSPGSSRAMEGVMGALAEAGHDGPLIAPDTLGNGDSAAPAPAAPDIAYFADSMVRLFDRMGLERVDLYGLHTGARIACEIAAAFPDRVGRLILDGITEYDAETVSHYLDHYVPQVVPDDYGRQFVWGFNFVRDQFLYAPYFRRDAEHRIARDMPDADELHGATIDMMKALGTYHLPYLAAFAYPSFDRAAAVRAPTLLLQPRHAPPMLNRAAEVIAARMPDARLATPEDGIVGHARAIMNFLQDQS